jgi:hypothetical protein
VDSGVEANVAHRTVAARKLKRSVR